MTNEKKLDEIITEWREQTDAKIAANQEALKFDIDTYNEKWSARILAHKVLLPLWCLFWLARMFVFDHPQELLFTCLPFLATVAFVFLQLRTNGKIERLDYGLPLEEFRAKEKGIWQRQLKALLLYRFFYYPAFGVYYSHEFWRGWGDSALVFVHPVGAFAIVAVLELGVRHMKKEIQNF